MLIYGRVGGTATLASVTAAINAAATADPNVPLMSAALVTALETPATCLRLRRIAPTNISLFPAGHPSGRAVIQLATLTPIAWNSR